TFGGSWSPSALLGPPRVYPRCGDLGGAWAPGPSRSPVEWIEVDFGADVPVAAVRIFETNRPGSTFAVVDATDGDALLYEAPPRADSEAQVLEVAVDPPRVVRRLRVYVVNPGWAELDTVGLIAVAPLPEALRTRPPPPPRGAGPLAWIVGLGVLAAVLAGVVAGVGAHRASAPRPRPAAAIGGATLRYAVLAPEAFAVRGVEWADEVTGFSSEYSTTANAAAAVRGAPDVYPRYGDLAGAWASRTTDGGEEWIEVRFALPVATTQVLWVETFNPGAVSRVDDLSDPAAPVLLWEGVASARPPSSVMAELTLPAPRTIRALRLVLDSRRVPGWNELDAVGLARSP
ncbi:MAG: blaR0, partial [Myxococcaceae bacterium]|nr:blaR0 [Myxococcaceae bacterium]